MSPAMPHAAAPSVAVSGISITHADRLVYPGTRLTKGDVAHYFETAARVMLPHIRRRPLSIVRCPAGLAGSCFFQKHWEQQRGVAVHTMDIPEDNGATVPYAVADRPADLVALVQHGMMEAHVWGSRADKLERPDRMVIDLDPGPGVSWSAVKQSAHEVRALLDGLSLSSWVKLTGGKGIHVVVPVARHVEWEVLAAFAKAVAQRMERNAPNTYVSKASKAARNRRIYVDWLRNTRGATSVAPWSVRAREGAPVSMPVTWEELDSVKKPDAFTMRNVPERLGARYADPWRAILTARQRLTASMADELLS